MRNIHWATNDEFNKAFFQARGTVDTIMDIFRGGKDGDRPHYGLKDDVPKVVDEIMKVMVDFSIRIRGDKDKPISIDYVRRRK